MNFSNRIQEMQFSPIRKLSPLAEDAKKQGKKVYHLNIGQPDIETPEEFFDAIKNFDKKVLAYAFSQGIPELIEAFIKYYKGYGINYSDDEILVTNGGSEALVFAMLACCDVGDEVLIPEPFYTNYNGFANYVGVKVVPITTKAENGFRLPSKQEITSLITEKTKAILLSNPGNPTGAVYDKEQIDMLKDISLEHNLYIISDEVYREFVYDGLEFISFASIDEIADRVILVDSISKRYSACGARVGCVASKNKEIINQMLKLCQGRLCVATLDQVGAAALANVSSDYMEKVYHEYKHRRDVVYSALKKIDGIICEEPKGAFYIIAKLPIKDAEKFAKWLLTDYSYNGATVMFAPAKSFYATEGLGLNEIRMSYVINEEDLRASMKILENALIAYKEIEG